MRVEFDITQSQAMEENSNALIVSLAFINHLMIMFRMTSPVRVAKQDRAERIFFFEMTFNYKHLHYTRRIRGPHE